MEKIKDLADYYGVSYFFMVMIVAGIAQGKNRSGLNWAILSLFFTPPFMLLILLFCSNKSIGYDEDDEDDDE
jgi:hypothetical protein